MKCWSHGTSQLLLIHNLKNEKIISRNSSLIRFVRYLKKQYTFVHKQATAVIAVRTVGKVPIQY